MARTKKIESDRLFSARMLHETVARFEDMGDDVGIDVMIYWSSKLYETLKLQENYYASQFAQQSQQEPFGSSVSPEVVADGSSERGPAAHAGRNKALSKP